MKVLVCGGREYENYERVCSVLDNLEVRPTLIIHGDARGADRLGKRWAIENGIKHDPYPADWETHHKAAGSIRNLEMLKKGRPHVVVAFPGGTGTAHMTRISENADVEVIRVAF